MDPDPFVEPFMNSYRETPEKPTDRQRRAEAVQDLALSLVRDGSKKPQEAFEIADEFYALAEERAAQANVEPGEDA